MQARSISTVKMRDLSNLGSKQNVDDQAVILNKKANTKPTIEDHFMDVGSIEELEGGDSESESDKDNDIE